MTSNMNKIVLSILLFGITISLHAQWKTSPFFQHENKSGYTVSLQTVENYLLSEEDTKIVMDILSAYHWEEFRIIEKQGIETWPVFEDNSYNENFDFYLKYCGIVVTHPDKRKITLQINRRGYIIEPYFSIEYLNKKPYKDLTRHNGSFYSWDVEKIKQLFLKYDVNFHNLAENEIVRIRPQFSFYDVFSKLTLPPTPVNTALSKQIIRLYNSGWNNNSSNSRGNGAYYSLGDEKTIYHSLWYPYVHHNLMLTSTGLVTPYFSNYNFDFKDTDTPQKLAELIDKMLQGHDGEGEQTLPQNEKIHYQYKDGLLHGELKKYSPDGKLTDEATFDKGLPVNYVKYAETGIKEIHFAAGDAPPTWANLTWTEYDEKGDVRSNGQSQRFYQNTAYGDYNDFQNFYKTKIYVQEIGTVTISFSKQVKIKHGNYFPENKEEVFSQLLDKAKQEYPDKDIEIRDVKISYSPNELHAGKHTVSISSVAKVVEFSTKQPNRELKYIIEYR